MSFQFPLVSSAPVAVVHTPNSILNHSKVPFRLLKLPNNRKRYSTCTDVAWINNDRHLAVLNFAGGMLHIYKFNRDDHSLTLIQTLDNQDGMQLHEPDKFSFSSNGLYLANTNQKKGDFSINLYQIDPKTNRINPVPIHIVKHKKHRFHGVRFSMNSKYLVATTIDDPGSIRVYSLKKNEKGETYLKLKQVIKNPYFPLKPKSINFSNDGSLMIACFSGNAGKKSSPSKGAIAIYSYNDKKGTIETEPLCELKERSEIAFTDDVSFSNDALRSYIVLTAQLNDTVVFYPFDHLTKKIDENLIILSNPKAELSFPHGLALSSDNKYLAVSNYGDDKVTIYSVK